MRPCPILLIVLSLVTHLFLFGHPKEVVFDETFQGNFLNYYQNGEYFFDVHPPLGKLLTKVVGDIGGVSYDMDFNAIGNALGNDIFILRLLPILAGIMLPLVVYFISRRLNMSEMVSFLVGVLMCIENSLVVQSKFILFDSVLLLFGFLSLLLYLQYTKSENKNILVFSAVLATAAFSIKWTGLAFPLLIGILELLRIGFAKKLFKLVAIYAFVGLTLYFSIFVIHFSLLPNPGPGDAFMTENFQSKDTFSKFIELNTEMYQANTRITEAHSYSSLWYTWPIMKRPVFYWENSEKEQYIYLLGNPPIYWLSILAIVVLVFSTIKRHIKKEGVPLAMKFVLIGYLVNFLPFIFIGRVMFLYHYQAALVFGIMAIGLSLEMIYKIKIRTATSLIILCACIVTFIFFAPLTYGLHLNQEELKSRMWLKTWR